MSSRQRELSRHRIRAMVVAAAAISTLALVAYRLVPHRGFVGTYFSDVGLERPVYREITSGIDFDWRQVRPYRLDEGTFSVRWAGAIEAASDDTYTFHVDAHGGYRLVVDGDPLIDRWTARDPSSARGSKLLGAGSHVLVVEYVDRPGNGGITVTLSSSSFERRPIEGGLLR